MTTHPPIQVRDFREIKRNTLLGFVTVELPSGLILYEVSLHEKNGACWASPAGRPMVDGSGQVMRDDQGKTRFNASVAFRDKATRDKFSKAVIAAVRQQHPEALA